MKDDPDRECWDGNGAVDYDDPTFFEVTER